MTTSPSVVDLTVQGDIGLVTVDAPPVNALSQAVRAGLVAAITRAAEDPAIKAVVLICAGRTFMAGADISEFGRPPQPPTFLEVEAAIEASPKPVVAAIHGTALGGGLEIALCCHYRIAVPSARCGLPEVNLGILPGAGGTQRLPRLVGVRRALEMMTAGQPVGAEEALRLGLVDEIAREGELRADALAFAERLVLERRPLRKVRDLETGLLEARGHPELFTEFRAANARRFRGFKAPEMIVRCVEAAVDLPFDEGMQVERALFEELVTGPQSAAQRYAFFAERAAGKIPGLGDDTPVRPVRTVGIIGAGTMGGGIAMTCLNAGLPVTLVETDQVALDRGLATMRANYERSARGGRFTMDEVEQRLGRLSPGLAREALADCDLVIEAAFERMEIKTALFESLDAICKPGAILATNTSALDIDEIASATTRPDDVVGLHFFSPANVMKLLEVVRTDRTSGTVIATAMKLARVLGKVPVLVKNGPGFVGNRMLFARTREANRMVLEGAMPWDIDRVLYDFGFPMGPFAMGDLAGLDLGWVKGGSRDQPLRDRLCELGRRGQKTGAGFYDYDAERKAAPSPITEEVIHTLMREAGVQPRAVSDEEILERSLYSMVNEAARILEEGKAIRASDVDVVWLNGYGWPLYRGGPMWWAEHEVGLGRMLARIRDYETALGETWRPAPLLERLVAEGRGFQDS